MACREQMAGALRQAGFRITPQRQVILEVVAHGKDHQSAQQVHLAARRRLPGLNLATVYRTLDSLNRAGLVDLMDDTKGSLRFSLRDPQHPHAHLVCRQCGQTFEFPVTGLSRLAQDIRRRTGFRTDLEHQAFSGLCRGCARPPSGQ
ncbi:MAG: transcriptional repressor [Anaerolineales bacterium]|nr:transcriptional repressor [Anaerolineales bacterium]